jgi:hypothetical protein
MLRAYLGIISRCGLESLWPEFDDTHRFLARQLSRERALGKLGVWAVMEAAAADEVHSLLTAGRYADSFSLLEVRSVYLGTILPEAPSHCREIP